MFIMNKLTLDALKERAEEVATEDLLAKISGGTDNDCHDSLPDPTDWDPTKAAPIDNTGTGG